MQPASPSSPAQGGLDDLFKSDQFRMECMKVVPCTKRYAHDWTECPFAHPHEKARRRDPRRFSYTGIACPSMRQEGGCTLGDNCPYSHNVFEYWLHPTRYRTQLCNDGATCARKICFFAHNLEELRNPEQKPYVPAEAVVAAAAAAAAGTSNEAHVVAAAAAQQLLAAQPPAPQAAVPHASPKLTGQEHPLVELMTRLVARGKVTPEKSAAILQQVLTPDALLDLQQSDELAAHSGQEAAHVPDRLCYSDPLGLGSLPAGIGSPQTMELPAHVSAAVALGLQPSLRFSAGAAFSPFAAEAAAAAAAACAPPSGQQALGEDSVASVRCSTGSTAAGVAEARLALLQGALQEAQARAALGHLASPGKSPHQVDPAGVASARSSLDTVRHSLDSSYQVHSLGPTPRPSWDAGYTTLVHQQLLRSSLQQQQVAQVAAQAAAIAAGAGVYWAPPAGTMMPDRASMDSQMSQFSAQAAFVGGRASMESVGGYGGALGALGSRPSMDAALSMDSIPPEQLLGAELGRMSLDEVAPRSDAFASGFYASSRSSAPPQGWEAGAGDPSFAGLEDASQQHELLHPRPRRSF